MQFIKTKDYKLNSGVMGFILFLCAAAAILGFPSVTSSGAYSGLKICSSIIVPALFPFTVASLFLVKSGGVTLISQKAGGFTNKIFGMSGAEFAVMVVSLLGGYPVGAKMASELKEQGQIGPNTAKGLLKYCINPSPAFFINIIGLNILGSKMAGILLFASNAITCIVLNIINAKLGKKREKNFKAQNKKSPLSVAFVESVTEGAKIIIGISAFVILFSAIAAVAKSIITNLDFYCLLCPVLEITFGAAEISKIGIAPHLYSLILCFGGLSTICQIKQAAGGIKAGFFYIMLYRIIHGVFSCGLSYLLFKIFPVTKEVINNGVAVTLGEIPLFLPAVMLIVFAAAFLLFINGSEKLKA